MTGLLFVPVFSKGAAVGFIFNKKILKNLSIKAMFTSGLN